MQKFVFSKVAKSRSRTFLPKKETCEKHNFHKFFYWVKTSGKVTESCRLSACNFTKNELLHRYLSGILTENFRTPNFQNTSPCLKPLTIFTKRLHLRCFTRFCVCLFSEVTSSIYQTYKFKVYLTHFEGIAMYLMSFLHA